MSTPTEKRIIRRGEEIETLLERAAIEQPSVTIPPFRVPAAVASAVSTQAKREGITRTDIARRALLFDLRNRGLLREAG